jgi:hypothetical protein
MCIIYIGCCIKREEKKFIYTYISSGSGGGGDSVVVIEAHLGIGACLGIGAYFL